MAREGHAAARHVKLPLRRKLLAGFAVALIPLFLLVLWEFRVEISRLERAALDEQLVAAQAVAVAVDRQLETAMGLAWAVSLDPRATTLDPAELDPYLTELVRVYPVVTSVSVFDREGDNRGYGNLSAGPGTPRFSVRDRAYFREVMAANAPAVSNVLGLRAAGLVGIVVAVPIRDDAGRAVGVVSVTLDAASLAKQHAERSTRAGQSVLLADADARLVFHTERRDLTMADADEVRRSPLILRALAGVEVTSPRFASPFLGDERLGAFLRTPVYGWVVGVTVPRDLALQPAYEDLRAHLGVFAVVLAVTLTLALLLARWLTRPVCELEAAARALGAGDLARRVDIHTGDEIEALGASFNEMAARLEERDGALVAAESRVRALNEELEARVHERTEALEAANGELEAFSYSVSHDLRAPLRAVDGFVAATLEDHAAALPPEAVGYLVRAQAGARRMNLLIDGLLALSRAARAPLTRIQVDMTALAREVAADLPAGGPVPVDVRVGKLPPAWGDPVLLRQVLSNLVGNAVKYSREHPRPRVEIGATDTEPVAWFVRDNGVGFDMAIAGKLFEPFQRLHDPKRFEGSGIGLAIVHRIITRHGGRVWAESEPGEGATFYFTLGAAPGGGTGA